MTLCKGDQGCFLEGELSMQLEEEVGWLLITSFLPEVFTFSQLPAKLVTWMTPHLVKQKGSRLG